MNTEKLQNYICKNCGEVWTDAELDEEARGDEGWLVLWEDTETCPDCCPH